MAKTIADELAKKQTSISVSEFFTKNRHLLGFDNPRRSLLTAIKEMVDNSLDACQDARILPSIKVKIKQLQEDRFGVIVEDNGPGIVKKQIPPIFARLLYGSKFFSMVQQRGQQGIGVCMTPDTLIPTGNGKVLPIEEIVEGKLNILVDLNKAGKGSSEARKLAQENMKDGTLGKIALFGLHPVARVLAAFILGVTSKKDARFFKTKEEALAWLKV